MFRRPIFQYHSVHRCVIRATSSVAPAKYARKPWFYASDIPRSKPYESNYKPTKAPEKFVLFSKNDSQKLELAFQHWIRSKRSSNGSPKVPVNEDLLFEVDIQTMELRATYWEGPTYEVRRGIWFDSSNKPLNYELTSELEKYYAEMNFKSNQEAENSLQDVFRLSRNYGKNSLVVFVDDETAYLLPDLEGGDLQLKLLRANIAPLLAMQGTKIIRGLQEGSIKNVAQKAKDTIDTELVSTSKQLGKVTDLISWELPSVFGTTTNTDDSESNKKSDKEDNDILKREIETDYDNHGSSSHSNNRNVKHLVLCVHGIGQNLGKKYEYVNFAHTVNLLRSNMKKLYTESKSLKKMNRESGLKDWENNCNVQVLPITWRHTIGFQTDATKPNEEFPELPTLGNITVNGVLGLRRLLGDVALDILLYGEPYYRERIMTEVRQQLNAAYHLFKEKNPRFGGEVHLIGHSLGSLILFDILSDQDKYKLDFEVKNYFCVGSPIGVFKLIQRSQIGPKSAETGKTSLQVQRPQCHDLYNLFHVCDPIAYRMEPLVDISMAKYEQAYLSHWYAGDSITSRVLEIGGNLLKDIPGKNKNKQLQRNRVRLSSDITSTLTGLNHSGRIDYSLPPGFLEVDIISAAKAHVSYFEEIDIAGFILKEILTKHENVSEIIVKKLRETDDD